MHDNNYTLHNSTKINIFFEKRNKQTNFVVIMEKNNNIIKSEVVLSADGSTTLRHSLLGDLYHSDRGAVGESRHVYIENGLMKFAENSVINLLEVGFGSGLNALLSIDSGLNINYTTIELYPLDYDVIEKLNYANYVSNNAYNDFLKLHREEWNREIYINNNFKAKKIYKSLLEIDFECEGVKNIDLVYFDAFSPDTQSELWSVDVFRKIYQTMHKDSILVTYSAKGVVKEALRAAGFTVSRKKGALGKHHMLVCTK